MLYIHENLTNTNMYILKHNILYINTVESKVIAQICENTLFTCLSQRYVTYHNKIYLYQKIKFYPFYYAPSYYIHSFNSIQFKAPNQKHAKYQINLSNIPTPSQTESLT